MRRLIIGCAALVLSGMASATDLVGVYQDALKYDPAIRQADATRKAQREANPQAWAALLPQINGNYSYARQKIDQTTAFPIEGPGGQVIVAPESVTQFTDSHGYQLQLTQSVFSWANWATLLRAHKQVAQAEADYHAAEEDLIQRVSTAYFNVLNAQDNLDAQSASLEALSRSLDQANKRFEVGLIAITDVKEAQATHDATAAQVIVAKRQLASMQRALREITDQDYPALAKPSDKMPLQTPLPADPNRWVDVSMDQNLALLSARLAADVARDTVRIQQAGHLPTLGITGTRSKSNTDNDQQFDLFGQVTRFPYPGASDNSQISLQVNVPIFSGGLVSSQARQAQFNWIAAKEHMAAVTRSTEHLARDSYSGVITGVAQVAALRQGLESAQVALRATEAGYEVGTRTEVEVLTSRQNLVQAQTNYAQALYSYIESIIELRLAAGNLDRHALEQINGWLDVSQPLPASPESVPTPGAPVQPGQSAGAAPPPGTLPQQLPEPKSR